MGELLWAFLGLFCCCFWLVFCRLKYVEKQKKTKQINKQIQISDYWEIMKNGPSFCFLKIPDKINSVFHFFEFANALMHRNIDIDIIIQMSFCYMYFIPCGYESLKWHDFCLLVEATFLPCSDWLRQKSNFLASTHLCVLPVH